MIHSAWVKSQFNIQAYNSSSVAELSVETVAEIGIVYVEISAHLHMRPFKIRASAH
jgi:hypothetical protein